MAQRDGHERTPQSADDHRSSGVSLLEVEPELGTLLTGEQLDQARRFALPARTVGREANLIQALEAAGAFGAIVLDGLLFHGTQIGKRPALRLLAA